MKSRRALIFAAGSNYGGMIHGRHDWTTVKWNMAWCRSPRLLQGTPAGHVNVLGMGAEGPHDVIWPIGHATA
jgi:hypothetical protein